MTAGGVPPLAGLVRAGDAQTEAVRIADGVFMAHDVSNLYLVTTSDGDVLVNTGFMTSAARNRTLFAPHRTGPLRAIVLTQHHADHIGGLDELREPGTQLIAHANLPANLADTQALQRFFGPRTMKLWASTLRFDRPPPPQPRVEPDLLVDRTHAFTIGERRFELIWTPDGETTDSLTVWLPQERIAFTGNLFGPVFHAMPNLFTMRGDKPRLVRDYLASLERVRDLAPELLVTGHGDPVRGSATIRDALDHMHAAVTWLRDYVLAGMTAGKDVHTLMRDVRLPDELAISEFHGRAAWNVRTIWEQYAGWFHYDSTTALYGVPRSSVDADLVELAGGGAALVARARDKLAADRPLEALHLLDIALGAAPDDRDARAVKKTALERLLAASGGQNLSETMWLRSEIAAADDPGRS